MRADPRSGQLEGQQLVDSVGVRITLPTSGNVLRLHGVVTTDDITPSSVPGLGQSNDASPETLRALLFHYLDAQVGERDLRDMVIVADHAFGMGSNRASSVLALQHAGIQAVIAKSIAPVYALGAVEAGLAIHSLGDDQAFFEAATPDATIMVGRDSLEVRRPQQGTALVRTWYPARRPSESRADALGRLAQR